MDEFRRKIAIHLVAQAADQHIHNIRLRVEGVVPYVLEDHRLRDDAPGVAQEVFEQGELSRLQFDSFAVARDLAREQIELQAAATQRRRFACLRGAADERLHAGKQFGKGKRLGEIIVAARLQAAHPVVHGTLRAEDEDRRFHLLGAPSFENAQAIAARAA